MTHSIRSSSTSPKGEPAQKERFGGEFFPNVVEAESGLVFAEFFQNERDTGRKGIVVLQLKEAAG